MSPLLRSEMRDARAPSIALQSPDPGARAETANKHEALEPHETRPYQQHGPAALSRDVHSR